MISVTSAEANKILNKLNDEKSGSSPFFLIKDSQCFLVQKLCVLSSCLVIRPCERRSSFLCMLHILT